MEKEPLETLNDAQKTAIRNYIDALKADVASLNALMANQEFSAGSITANGYIYTTTSNGHITTTGLSAGIYTSGANAVIQTLGANAHITTVHADASIFTQGVNSAIQTRGSFRMFNGAYFTTILHAPTDTRTVTLGDATGVLPVVPAYANLTAANAALDSGDFFWDTTLKKLRVATA